MPCHIYNRQEYISASFTCLCHLSRGGTGGLFHRYPFTIVMLQCRNTLITACPYLITVAASFLLITQVFTGSFFSLRYIIMSQRWNLCCLCYITAFILAASLHRTRLLTSGSGYFLPVSELMTCCRNHPLF